MSRHRDIRNMDFSEDYNGYDDVYGHSVDDDIYISPSHRQFMYNRENSGSSRSDFPMEEDIQEEDETEEEVKLSDGDKAKLESCLDYVKSVLAPMRMSRSEIVKVIISQKFDCEKIVNSLLKMSCSPKADKKDKDETVTIFKTLHQKLSQSPNTSTYPSSQIVEAQSKALFNIPIKLDKQSGTPMKKSIFGDLSKKDTLESSRTSKTNGVLTTLTPDLNLANTFLSKIKKKPNLEHGTGNDSSISSFSSQMNSENSPQLSFFPKLTNTENGVKKNLSNDFLNKLTIHKSPELMKMVQQSRVHSSSFNKIMQNNKVTLDKTYESMKSKVPLSKNGIKFPLTDEPNKVFSGIGQKEFLNVKKINSDCLLPSSAPSCLAKDISRLGLTDVKSTPVLNEGNEIVVNLTEALKKSKLETMVSRPVCEEKKFDMPFMCDEETDDATVLECTMDLSHLAMEEVLFLKKKPSPLGKILCLRFKVKKFEPYTRKRNILDPRLKKFNFSEPSPDDQIKKYIKRNI